MDVHTASRFECVKMTTPYRILAVVVAIALIVAGVLAYGAKRYAAGEQAGRNAVLADDARAAASAQMKAAALQSISLQRGQALTLQLSTDLPRIEATSHATQSTIRTIYRDRPTAAGVDLCSRPAGVQEQLDAAITRANAAAGDHL